MLPSRLSDLFYRPFLSLLLDTYNFLNAEELTVFAKYLAQHGQDDITNFPNIKKKCDTAIFSLLLTSFLAFCGIHS